jgi:hypothetical protein
MKPWPRSSPKSPCPGESLRYIAVFDQALFRHWLGRYGPVHCGVFPARAFARSCWRYQLVVRGHGAGHVIRLFRVKAGISASRHTLAKWSNGDENPVTVEVRNRYPFPWTCGCWTSCPCSCKNAAWTCNVASLRGRRKRSPTWCGRSRAGCMRMAPSTC